MKRALRIVTAGRAGGSARADERQRASGDPAAARLLARMRRIEHEHARPAPRQQIRGPRAARSGADDRDVVSIASAPYRSA